MVANIEVGQPVEEGERQMLSDCNVLVCYRNIGLNVAISRGFWILALGDSIGVETKLAVLNAIVLGEREREMMHDFCSEVNFLAWLSNYIHLPKINLRILSNQLKLRVQLNR